MGFNAVKTSFQYQLVRVHCMKRRVEKKQHNALPVKGNLLSQIAGTIRDKARSHRTYSQPRSSKMTDAVVHTPYPFRSRSSNTKICSVCENHRSRRRLRCQLCHLSRALPSCVPEHCYIHGLHACRDCAITLIGLMGVSRRNSGTPFPMGVADVVISFL